MESLGLDHLRNFGLSLTHLHGVLLDLFVFSEMLVVLSVLKVGSLWLGHVRGMKVVGGFLSLWLCKIFVLLLDVSLSIDGLFVDTSFRRVFGIRFALNYSRRLVRVLFCLRFLRQVVDFCVGC
jgi:hypothetical protein